MKPHHIDNKYLYLRSLLLCILFFYILFSLFACSPKNNIKETPRFKIVAATLAKGIDDSGNDATPIMPTTVFSTNDSKVVSYIKFENISGKHDLRWDWYRPDGRLYTSTGNFFIGSDRNKELQETVVWHTMLLDGEQAANDPGRWRVDIYYDEELIVSNAFTVASIQVGNIQQALGMSALNAYAVIIGISNYLHSTPGGLDNLAFADDDAIAMKNALIRIGWNKSHIKLLTNEKATRNNILIALESWLTKAGPDDKIVLFWSGHGYPDPEDPEKVYFACYDTIINIPATGYRMDRVHGILKERKAKNVIVLADTCHAGKLITRGNKGMRLPSYVENLKQRENIPNGWIFMVGADTDRVAIEHSSWSNGAFTHCLLNAINGAADGYESIGPKDGIVTMGELRGYMYSVMPDITQQVLGVAKHPIITTSTGDPDIWNLSLQIK